jgi:transcription antitermination factor NusG
MTDTNDITHWYAGKVKYRTESKIKTFLETRGIEHYIPFHTVMVERRGKKKREKKPVLPSFIFIRTIRQTLLSVPVESGYGVSYIRNLETKEIQTIPDKQMQDFMFLLDFSEDTLRITNTNLKRGDRVRVIKGPFSGIEGELIRIKGHKRVVVRLEGLFSLATTYIPGEFLEKCDKLKTHI